MTRGPTEVPANQNYSATLNWATRRVCKHTLLLFMYLLSEALKGILKQQSEMNKGLKTASTF